MRQDSILSKKLINVGFAVALVLSLSCLLMSAGYLFSFLRNTNNSVEKLLDQGNKQSVNQSLVETAIYSRLATTRITFLSCGVFVGMSFGFLGFALFLMGIKEEMDVSGSSDSYKLKISRMSPGAFVILLSVILIAFCVAHQMPFDYQHGEINSTTTPSPPDVPGPIKP